MNEPSDRGDPARDDSTAELRLRDTDRHPRVTPPVIEVEDVWKTYRTGSLEVDALRGVSFEIRTGEYVAIMGPSGSGKSTLMHILGCLDVPTSGSFRLADEDVSSMSEEDLAHVRNRRIGFVFQQFNLLPSLTAWRNVELPLVYAGVDRGERRRRALEALDRVGLSSRVEHRPGELSGGQQQRVAMARAVVTDPALILADEPTGNLDSASAGEVLDLLAELNASGRTIVLITHEADVASAADRIMRIRDGRILDAVVDGGRGPVNVLETFRTGFEAVLSHRLRSGLTVLGIMIGIAAVILTVGLGRRSAATGQLADLGARLEPAHGDAGQLDLDLRHPRRLRHRVDPHPRRRNGALLQGRGSGHRGGRSGHERVARRWSPGRPTGPPRWWAPSPRG